MKIETIESNVIADWVDVRFNGKTHYEVYRGENGWCVKECGYSDRKIKTGYHGKVSAVALAIKDLASDILTHSWTEEHHSEPFKVLCHACSYTFETPRNHDKPWCCPGCHNKQISVVN